MPIEKAPKNPLPQAYVPPASIRYKVTDGDSWLSVAAKFKMTPAALIEFNFKTQDPAEINWYLRRNVGCRKQTADGKNWMFSSNAGPGVIYRPQQAAPPTVVREAPTKVCPEELDAANETLRKSQEVANTILQPRATSDCPYWFARLYQYITMYEIQDREALSYPCFVLHFIPVFYDSYFVAADAFMKKANIPAHWQEHFNMAGLFTDPAQIMPYMNAVTNSVITGVTAHIKGDMAPSLEKAYRSFSAKYSSVPPFDTYKPDFFDRNRPIFEKVRLALINEVVNRATGLAMMGKSVDPNFASKAADVMNMGLNVDEIYGWREDAWRTARFRLEGH